MSGGSYEYLYCKQLTEGEYLVAQMANSLKEDGHKDAANRTKKVLKKMKEIQQLQMELADVWQAQEWYESCDYGPGDVTEAVRKWRGERKP